MTRSKSQKQTAKTAKVVHECMTEHCDFRHQKKWSIRRHYERDHSTKKGKVNAGQPGNTEHSQGLASGMLANLPFLSLPNCIRLAAELVEQAQRDAPVGQTAGLTRQQTKDIASQLLAHITSNMVEKCDTLPEMFAPPSLPGSPPPVYDPDSAPSTPDVQPQAGSTEHGNEEHEAMAPARPAAPVPRRVPSILASPPQALPVLENLVRSISTRPPSVVLRSNVVNEQAEEQFSDASAADHLASWASFDHQSLSAMLRSDTMMSFSSDMFYGSQVEASDISMIASSSVSMASVHGPTTPDFSALDATLSYHMSTDFQEYLEPTFDFAQVHGMDYSMSSGDSWGSSALSPGDVAGPSHLPESSSYHDLSYGQSYQQTGTSCPGNTPGPSLHEHSMLSVSDCNGSAQYVFGTPTASSNDLNVISGATSPFSSSSLDTIMHSAQSYCSDHEFGFSPINFSDNFQI
ncbi:hypothetical protein CERSUDRAFT_89844 [Gelatoporia subvermispora B]|uniref:Uncharacterized protein n=1 Tax=Ceriporiopsis subvermispora (strain B) TaxID=914234 RepID=M2RA21_CERS8|nr:hypothetical protein CERSUDRAFT_89844 [Gelatoporia subvermispora B]